MLFNSTIFIFAFLPLTLAVYFALGRLSIPAARLWLAVASLFFYAWWYPPYLVLLCASIVFNFGVGWLLQFPETLHVKSFRRWLLGLGLAFNIGFLGYFKYQDFLIENFDTLTGADFNVAHVALPLAISFFTFQKIAYLVDSYLGKVKETSFINYILFAAFFPQLIAGPIIHYSEVFPQFKKADTYRFHWVNFTDGLILFMLGLAKKVVLADEFARYSDVVFSGAQGGAAISLVPAWVGALSYTLQLYFDFSGFSDMAVGLAKMFNIDLPLNFWSPYKSVNIIEFWKRWHMTLFRFLRDYVYIPLGGDPLWRDQALPQLVADDAHRWDLARGGVDLCLVGRAAWPCPRVTPSLAALARRGCAQPRHPYWSTCLDPAGGGGRLGDFPQPIPCRRPAECSAA